jgi:hypothetical protein
VARARPLLVFAPLIVAALLAGSTCDTVDDCTCFPCGSAIGLTVLDQDGNALNDGWVMAATLDGAPVDDGSACDVDIRAGNSCIFGTATGVYRIVVEDDGRQPREVAARSAVESGQDCCAGACALETEVVVRLLPE